MPQFDPIFNDADKVLAGRNSPPEKGIPAPAPFDPIFVPADKELDAARMERLTPRTAREARLMGFLRATEPETGLLKELPMLGAGIGANVLASKGLTALAERVGLPALGRFLTGAAGGLAKLPSLAASGALQGAVSSGVNRLFGEETPLGTSAAVGAGVNALTGGIGSALLGNNISPEAAQRALAAREAGVPLVTGNVPGASFAARLAGKLSGATKPDVQGFTKQIMRSVGSDADLLSGETLAAAKRRLQGDPGNLAAGVPPALGEFDRIAQGAKPITWSNSNIRPELADIVAEAQNKYGLLQSPDEMRRVLGQVQNVKEALDAGGITGDQLQAITSMNSALSQHASANSAGSYLATRLKRALYNAAGQADPETAKALSLARNQYRNISMLEPKVEQLTDASGLVDPAKVAARIRQTYGNFEGASQAAQGAGQPTDLGTLGEAGQRFGQQPVARPSFPTAVGVGAGLGTLGAEELLSGFPAYESLTHHPLLALGATAGLLGGVIPAGATQNLMTNFLLSRASRGLGPLLGGTNPLIGAGVASQGSSAPSVPQGSPLAGSEGNWSNWLRGQAFLESPRGESSTKSSAKGYFQFLDGTAKQAQQAGLPNPQEGDYPAQAAATKVFIERFHPRAAAAIEQGDYPTAVSLLAPIWPSLPGGSQAQAPSQYAQWNKILSAGGSPQGAQ